MLIRIFSISTPPPPNTLVGRPTNESTSALGLTRTSSSLNIYPQQRRAKSVTSCAHQGHGQELCHLCHQRARRNIPIYLHEEKRQREIEDTKLLEQFQHDRDLEEQRKRDVTIFLEEIFFSSFEIFLGGNQSSTRRKTKNCRCRLNSIFLNKRLSFYLFSLIWVLPRQHERKNSNDHKQRKYPFVFFSSKFYKFIF